MPIKGRSKIYLFEKTEIDKFVKEGTNHQYQ